MKINMDKLPTVISCCFCCFLRAGTVMIALFSFCSGLVFTPNVNSTKGFWDLNPVLLHYSAATEVVIQFTLGIVSIMLCIVSILLMIGAICNIPRLILIYQWGAIVYSLVVFIMFLVLAMFCFFVHPNSVLAGGVLCGLIVIEVLLTTYFVIVANSLRVSLAFIADSNLFI